MEPIAIKWSRELEKLLSEARIEGEDIQYFLEKDLKEIPIATAFKKVLSKLLKV